LRKLYGEGLLVFEEYCKSALNLVKTHTFCHFESAALIYEDPSSLSTEEGEHGHKAMTKDPWRSSNHRNESTQMTKKVTRTLSRKKFFEESSSKQKRGRRFSFSLFRIITLLISPFSENQLAGNSIFSGTLEKLKKDPHFNSKLEGLELLTDLLREKVDLVETVTRLRIFNSLYLEGDEGKRVVASPSFHGQPRFDFVILNNSAKVRVLTLLHVNGASWAFVQKLTYKEEDDLLQVPRLELTNNCDLIPIDQPCDLIYLIRDPRTENIFWENLYYQDYSKS